MKRKICRSIPLLFAALFIGLAVTAQPGYHNDNDRNDRNDYGHGQRRDHDDNYDYDDHRYNGNYRPNNYEQYSVRRRPSAPDCVQPVRPSRGHVWIDAQWIWNRGQYVYQAGYWTVPRRSETWVPGHWERSHHRWFWVSGYWTRTGYRW